MFIPETQLKDGFKNIAVSQYFDYRIAEKKTLGPLYTIWQITGSLRCGYPDLSEAYLVNLRDFVTEYSHLIVTHEALGK